MSHYQRRLSIETRGPGLTEFTRQVQAELSDEAYLALQWHLLLAPESGALIPGSGGLRKLRWALQGKGKSGGARIIYYFHSDRMPVVMLSIYAKNTKVNLSQAERNELKTLVPELVREFMKGRRS